jgi:hypothetical protein
MSIARLRFLKLVGLTTVAIAIAGCSSSEDLTDDTVEGADALSNDVTDCHGFTLQFGRLKANDRSYSLIIDKTCRFSEGLGAVWSYEVTDDQSTTPIRVESTKFPAERSAIDRAISRRLDCPKQGVGDVGRIRKEVIPQIERSDAATAITNLKAIVLKPVVAGC